MGMTLRRLTRYAAVRAALEELQELHRVKGYMEKAPLIEEDVRRNVDRAVEQVRTAGQVMAVKRIVRYSGLSAETLRWYPAVWQKIRLLIAETIGGR
jgi:P2-related tail formation protein